MLTLGCNKEKNNTLCVTWYSAPGKDDPYAQVNNGYTEMTDMGQHQGASGPAAVPDYAVVDMLMRQVTKQKPPVEAQYARVNNSKKEKGRHVKENEEGMLTTDRLFTFYSLQVNYMVIQCGAHPSVLTPRV